MMVASGRDEQPGRAGGKRRTGAARASERPSGPILYNFRRPDKFSKDHIRSIQSIQEAFSRLVTNFLASNIRSAVHIDLASQEQSTFGEYLDQLPQPTVLFVTELEPLTGSVVIQLDRQIALTIVDRLLGGPGVARMDRGPAAITEIEMLLLEDLAKGLFGEFVNAWEQVANLRATRCEVALSPLQVQGVMPTEVALVIRHEVRMYNTKGKLTICLPASTLEPLMPRLNARLLFANPRSASGSQSELHLMHQLASAPLTVRVEIGKAQVRVDDLYALEVGDIIRLDTPTHTPMIVRVEDRACFLGQPGQRSGQLSVRIVDYVEDEAMEFVAEGDLEHE
jgi:flagellar motor switch protein FliM